MLRDEANIALFEKYRNNELNETDLNSFESRIANDKLFNEEFEDYKSVEEGVKNHFRNELKRELKSIDEKLDSKPNETRPLAVKKIVMWTASIAAILIISLLVVKNYTSTNYRELAFNSWQKEPGLPVKMSSKAELDEAMNAYKLEDYLLAESLFIQFDSDTANFYLANTQYELEKYPEALITLGQIKENSIYYHDAQFKKALILLILDKIDDARVILEKISQQEDNLYFQKALSLLNNI
jgi:TolA-binding protein